MTTSNSTVPRANPDRVVSTTPTQPVDPSLVSCLKSPKHSRKDGVQVSLERSSTLGKDFRNPSGKHCSSVHTATDTFRHYRGTHSGTERASRDEESTFRNVGDERDSREPPAPVTPERHHQRGRSKKRRATASFDDDEADHTFDKTAEVVRVQTGNFVQGAVKNQPVARKTVRFSLPEASTFTAKPERYFSGPRASLQTPLAKPKLSVRVDEVDDDDLPLQRLENVTALSRSLIPQELLNPPRPQRRHKMASAVTTASENGTESQNKKSKSIRKRMKNFSKKKSERRDDTQNGETEIALPALGASDNDESRKEAENRPVSRSRGTKEKSVKSSKKENSHRRSRRPDEAEDESLLSSVTEATPVQSNRSRSPPQRGRTVMDRVRSVSRSLSRSRKSHGNSSSLSEPDHKILLIAVTSCKSDAYYNQKAPGSTSKLPRKAPSNLKLFHELAVAVKDAYAALGETPTKPNPDAEENGKKISKDEFEARTVLWEFIGNLDFLLALVDEVATDTATRGALKDDHTFKALRDVIKKCNKILESMLVRRERKYTLFIRLVQPNDIAEVAAMKSWNSKVEKAVGSVADSRPGGDDDSDTASDTASSTSASTEASSSSRRNVFARGRQLLPSAGRRSRRATPTPRLRNRGGSTSGDSDDAAEDGFSAHTQPVTSGNLAMLQRSLGPGDPAGAKNSKVPKQQLAPMKVMEPKDELVDVIKSLREEKIKNREGTAESDLATLKPNWRPKADIPSAVPKLPIEYVHRHKLMKQVVNCLCDRSGAGPRDTDEESPGNAIITSITSRHGDKAGNGKTTLAVASIQTVEVRERFSDGIGWVHLGRNPLTENDVRRLYDELYRQLVIKDLEVDSDDDSKLSSQEKENQALSRHSSRESLDGRTKTPTERNFAMQLANTRRRFQGGDLEGIKEELGRLLAKRNVLICLDDVWRVEDAKWFIFDESTNTARGEASESSNFRILITTRTPSLLGPGVVQEVFVRIFSEHEAVKLLLASAGRRPYGGKNSEVFNQARSVVKGCGNAPLAVRIAGGTLRRSNRNWNLSSPAWRALVDQCKLNLEEAAKLRSFVFSTGRIVDLSFMTVEDIALRSSMRRCLATFAMAFRDHEWVLVGRGIPRSVILKLFAAVAAAGLDEALQPSPEAILEALEALNLLQRARHGVHSRAISTPSTTRQESGESEDLSPDDEFDEDITPSSELSLLDNSAFLISDAIKVIAENMATRTKNAFLPNEDEYTSFTSQIEEENSFVERSRSKGMAWASPLRKIARHLSNGMDADKGDSMEESAIHELVVASLLDSRVARKPVLQAFHDSAETVATTKGGDKLEEYLVTFLPTHLLRAKSHQNTAELLVDAHFVGRRVKTLGVVEASRRQMVDLLDLRREAGKGPSSDNKAVAPAPSRRASDKSQVDDAPVSPRIEQADSEDVQDPPEVSVVDGYAVLRDGSRLVVEEIYRHLHSSNGSSDSLNMAICLSFVGEGLLKGRQIRDAMVRLEEAVGMYRNMLGTISIDVARSLHSVAKAFVKLGESRVAILKFAEATRIYAACQASMHYDAISNAQSYASLLVEVEEWSKADAKFDEVITMKKAVYGDNSVPVAKAINSYAILLAKHGKMDKALMYYEAAMAIYQKLPTPVIHDPEFDMKCKYDMTLINLNIASIRSKRGLLQGAVESYEQGVQGLRDHAEEQERLQKSGLSRESVKGTSQHKHLVAALGRIGSLKLKLGDLQGSLEAYLILLEEVRDDSPATSQVEKAKAHIKCATIYRQLEEPIARKKSVPHLREALEMYTTLFGVKHKDTQAIASSLRQWVEEDRQAS